LVRKKTNSKRCFSFRIPTFEIQNPQSKIQNPDHQRLQQQSGNGAQRPMDKGRDAQIDCNGHSTQYAEKQKNKQQSGGWNDSITGGKRPTGR